ncbi:hypothetical protein [Hyphomonas sp.]|uniref:hypothetical protein n=1 Tax=Hyphomonas sp. TaxID=87 RepID=UPI00391916D2
MCVPIDDFQMLCWLRGQLRILTAWREELASRPDQDLEALSRLEAHHDWLQSELGRLESAA